MACWGVWGKVIRARNYGVEEKWEFYKESFVSIFCLLHGYTVLVFLTVQISEYLPHLVNLNLKHEDIFTFILITLEKVP